MTQAREDMRSSDGHGNTRVRPDRGSPWSTPRSPHSREDTSPGVRGSHQATNPIDYVEFARTLYKPIGDPKEFLAHVARMVSARAMLASPQCDTPEKEAQGRQLLSLATGKALEVLAGEVLTPIGMVTVVARLVREMEPAEFDTWVDLQFSGGYHLGLVAAARNPLDLAREEPIEDHLEKGELAAGLYLPVLNHMRTFVGSNCLAG